MDDSNYSFPTYRKYTGINVWFKIISDRKFIEIKQIGDRFVLHELEANQYPEMVLIQDMLRCLEGRWEEILSVEFEEVYAQVKST